MYHETEASKFGFCFKKEEEKGFLLLLEKDRGRERERWKREIWWRREHDHDMKVAEQSGIDGERGNKKCRREKKMNENENEG